MTKLPFARTTDIVVQTLGQEILVYDLNTHKAYNLNETSSIVYQACDGKTSFDELKRRYKFTDDLIFLALDDLKKSNLIDDSFKSPFDGMNRREVIRKAGLASLIALPVISSLIAPSAAMAQSSACNCSAPINSNARLEGCSCDSNDDCCGVCLFNGGNPVCSAPTAAAQPTAAACCPPLV